MGKEIGEGGERTGSMTRLLKAATFSIATKKHAHLGENKKTSSF